MLLYMNFLLRCIKDWDSQILHYLMIISNCCISKYVCMKLFAGWSDTPSLPGDVIRAPPTNYLQQYGFFAVCIMRTAIEKKQWTKRPWIYMFLYLKIWFSWSHPTVLVLWISLSEPLVKYKPKIVIPERLCLGYNSARAKLSVYAKVVLEFYHHHHRTNPIRCLST